MNVVTYRLNGTAVNLNCCARMNGVRQQETINLRI